MGEFWWAVADADGGEVGELVEDLAARGTADAFFEESSFVGLEGGKPAPDVYLTVARLLGVVPESCAAVEDSSNGLRSAAAAGMAVTAVPRPEYPPAPDALAGARLVLGSLTELTVAAVTALG